MPLWLQPVLIQVSNQLFPSELTEEQIRNQNGARLLSKPFVQQQDLLVTGKVFQTERLTFNEQEYLKNINEKVSVRFEF